MKNNYCIGIDTSAYTTSIAAVDNKKNIVFDKRKILDVKRGNRGLRQQEAIYKHLLNLPQIISELSSKIDFKKACAIAASTKPRNIEKSYMPVFNVSYIQAQILSDVLNIPLYKFSHQEGHIASALVNNTELNKKKKFLVLHISGGTTELVYIKNNKCLFDTKIIGGTKDISIGQLIDRVGVKLGLKFPCGKELDDLSINGNLIEDILSVKTKDTWLNLSGPETYFLKLIEMNRYCREDIAKSLFYIIEDSLNQIIINAVKKYNINDIVIVGGVASNTYIRSKLNKKIDRKNTCNIYFPDSKYCVDNAVGIAYLGSIYI